MSGRDAGALDEIKQLIRSEEERSKQKKRTSSGKKGGGGRAAAEEDGGDDSDEEGGVLRRAGKRDREEDQIIPEEEEGKEGAKAKKGYWRAGKFHEIDPNAGKSAYRDRALERRVGHNPDYDDQVNRMAEMDAETSKYLGGDMKHTHLVKGLDYALLLKARHHLQRGDGEDEAEELERGLASLKSRAGGGVLVSVGEDGLSESVETKTSLGKLMWDAWQLQARRKNLASKINRNFDLIAYEYNLEDGADGVGDAALAGAEVLTGSAQMNKDSDIPVVITRSKGEVGDDDETEGADRLVNYIVKPALLNKLEEGLARFRKYGKGKKMRKRPRVEGRAGAVGVGVGIGGGGEDDDDDGEAVSDYSTIAAPPPPPSTDMFEGLGMGNAGGGAQPTNGTTNGTAHVAAGDEGGAPPLPPLPPGQPPLPPAEAPLSPSQPPLPPLPPSSPSSQPPLPPPPPPPPPPTTTSAKKADYFSGLRHRNADEDDDVGADTGPTKEEIQRSIRQAAARAVLGEDPEEGEVLMKKKKKKKIDRDVFGAGALRKQKAAGQLLSGLHEEYGGSVAMEVLSDDEA